MVLAKAVKKNKFNCCYVKNFPPSAFMMMTAHLYFSICSCKNVEANELAQQKLKPKLISCWSKCSMVSLSGGTLAANPGKKISIKNRNRWQREHQSPFVEPCRLHACGRQAQSLAANCRELCFALLLGVPGTGSCSRWCRSPASPSPAGRLVPAKALYELF